MVLFDHITIQIKTNFFEEDNVSFFHGPNDTGLFENMWIWTSTDLMKN